MIKLWMKVSSRIVLTLPVALSLATLARAQSLETNFGSDEYSKAVNTLDSYGLTVLSTYQIRVGDQDFPVAVSIPEPVYACDVVYPATHWFTKAKTYTMASTKPCEKKDFETPFDVFARRYNKIQDSTMAEATEHYHRFSRLVESGIRSYVDNEENQIYGDQDQISCANQQGAELKKALKQVDYLGFLKKLNFNRFSVQVEDARMLTPDLVSDYDYGYEAVNHSFTVKAVIDNNGKCKLLTAEQLVHDFEPRIKKFEEVTGRKAAADASRVTNAVRAAGVSQSGQNVAIAAKTEKAGQSQASASTTSSTPSVNRALGLN